MLWKIFSDFSCKYSFPHSQVFFPLTYLLITLSGTGITVGSASVTLSQREPAWVDESQNSRETLHHYPSNYTAHLFKERFTCVCKNLDTCTLEISQGFLGQSSLALRREGESGLSVSGRHLTQPGGPVAAADQPSHLRVKAIPRE